MKLTRIFSLSLYAAGVTLFLGFGYLVAHGGWWIPTQLTPPQNNVVRPVTTGVSGQTKLGALILNTGLSAPSGLTVYGNAIPAGCATGSGAGCVGIGTTNPSEKLDVVGNINLSGIAGNPTVRGLIKPNGDQGLVWQNLIATGPNGMSWEHDNAWMTIQRIDINAGGTCTSFFPGCPAGWIEYGTHVFNASCSQTPVWTYGNAIRVCFQRMQ